MSRKKIIIKAGGLAVAAVFAANALAGSAALATANPLMISEVVEAAENGAFDGTYTYMVNDMGEPEPAIINGGSTVAVAMFYGTMIQLSCNEGVAPVVTAGCDDVAVAGANATNDGVLIAGIAVGNGIITVQDSASGAITYIAVNVVDSVGTGTAATTTTTTTTATSTATPWSTAYVYGLYPIDTSQHGTGGGVDGSSVSACYNAGTDWVAQFVTATTTDGQTLQYQFLSPKGLLDMCGAHNGYYNYNDANGNYTLTVYKDTWNKHLWEYTKEQFLKEAVTYNFVNAGAEYYDTVDEGAYYRITFSSDNVTYDGASAKAITSIVEVKATGEVYAFRYLEKSSLYDDTRAKSIIYSCIPTNYSN